MPKTGLRILLLLGVLAVPVLLALGAQAIASRPGAPNVENPSPVSVHVEPGESTSPSQPTDTVAPSQPTEPAHPTQPTDPAPPATSPPADVPPQVDTQPAPPPADDDDDDADDVDDEADDDD